MVRGVCILAVVMIHCPQGAVGVDKAIWLVIRQFINFPVALFIFMAGYFVAPKSVNMKWLVNRGGATHYTIYFLEHHLYNKKCSI